VLLQDPPLVPLLFSHSAAAWLWLGVRLWLGYQWLAAASHKLADAGWTDGSGSALRRYWTTALETTRKASPSLPTTGTAYFCRCSSTATRNMVLDADRRR